MKSKSVSPIIATLLLIGIALVIAGITYTWTSTYTQEQTKAVEQQADVNTLVQAQSAIGLVLKSATANGRLIIANNSSQSITIDRLILDGNLVSISPVSIPAGSIASIDANQWLSEGQSITLITTAGSSKTITVSSETLTQYTSTASFSDLLDYITDINSDNTTANITSGEARLSGQPAWFILGTLNISNTPRISKWPSLALDSNGFPSIAWHDNTSGNYEIYYRDWNGTNWVTASGNLNGLDLNVSNNTGNSWHPSLKLDSNDNPSIAWHDDTSGNNEVYYREWNGNSWVTASGNLNDLDLNVSNNTEESWYPSLALDSNDNPSIAWQDYTSGNWEIYYREWNGIGWGTIDDLNVSNTITNSEYPSLALDSNDNPSIAWQDGPPANSEIYYRDWNGTDWATVTGDLSGLSLNASNNSGDSEIPSLALDINDNPSIAWQDSIIPGGAYEIYYREWNEINWVTVSGDTGDANLNVSNTLGNSFGPSLALDSNSNNPSIAWTDEYTLSNWEIYYREWNENNWVTVSGDTGDANLNVSNTNEISWHPSLALDSNSNNPSIAWTDEYTLSNWEIYYREWNENFASGGRVESIEVDSVYTNILSATLTASTLKPAGTLIRFFLSNDNGSTWLPATSGVQVDFNVSGSQLKWRAYLNSTSSKITPSIYDVSISYVYEI